jgi:hypothetical protein
MIDARVRRGALARLVISGLVLLAGCAPWQRVAAPETVGPDGAFEVRLPLGWVRSMSHTDKVLVTRDGLALQQIEIVRRPHAKAFPRLEEASRPDMLPNEVASLVLAELRGQPQVKALEVEDNRPVKLAGRDAFRVTVGFLNERGLGYRMVVYGFVDAQGLCTLSYRATRLHYFERDIGSFEGVVASFRSKVG